MTLLGVLVKTAIGVGALLVLAIVYELWSNLYWYPRASRSRGCEPPHFLNMRPLGIPLVYRAVRSFVGHNVNEFVRKDVLNGKHTVRSSLGPITGFLTDDPENIKTILATSFKDYSLGWRYNMFYVLLGNGIFTLSGEGWKHSRAMLRPQFSREQVTHLDSIKEHVNKLIIRLNEGADSGKLVDAQELLHCLTIDTATEFLFGESTETLTNSTRVIKGPNGDITGPQFAKSFAYCQEILAYRFMSTALFPLIDGPTFRSEVRRCKGFIDYFVQNSLQTPMEKDQIADKFVFMNELTKETRDPVVIRDQAFNILLAGRDTTASLMSFMAGLLSKHKHIYKKLRAAVLEDFGTDESSITFESLKRCKYLTYVLNETLRLHPIVAFNFREAVRDTKLPRGGGPNGDKPVFIPKGTSVAYSPYSMQRSADYWGDQADEFIPERWENAKGHGWEFLPFNGGPRICLGQQFALTEMSVTWVRLCQTYDDFETELSVGNVLIPKMHQRLTISVSGGVPSRWHRANT